jgi:hypothetical protein
MVAEEDLHARVDRWHVKIAHAVRLGDIPHGWAAAGFMLLPREILFFEAGEDDAGGAVHRSRDPAAVATGRRRAGRHGNQRGDDVRLAVRLHAGSRGGEPAGDHRHHAPVPEVTYVIRAASAP